MQFSCWNPGDVNRAKLLAVTSADPWFSIAEGIAGAALSGGIPDETNGADSYYALSMETPPEWVKGATHTYSSDGWHSFWRVEHTITVASTSTEGQKTVTGTGESV